MNATSVILLRRREPDRERPFRVPGYPVIPVLFIALAVLLLVNSIVTNLVPSLLGLGITAAGAVAYLIFNRRAS